MNCSIIVLKLKLKLKLLTHKQIEGFELKKNDSETYNEVIVNHE